jgi:hypothetical protein
MDKLLKADYPSCLLYACIDELVCGLWNGHICVETRTTKGVDVIFQKGGGGLQLLFRCYASTMLFYLIRYHYF